MDVASALIRTRLCDEFESRDQTGFQRELTLLHADTASIKELHIIPTSTPTLAATHALTSTITINLFTVFSLYVVRRRREV